MRRTLWCSFAFSCLCAAALYAQAPSMPAFEVASVKANKSDAPATSRFPLGPGDAYVPGNLFVATNQPLIAYLRFAFKLGQGDLLGLPMWIYTERFDVQARAQGNPAKDDMRLMTRSVLADRFKLQTHVDHRTGPVFNLALAKAGRVGPQLHLEDGSCVNEPALAPGVPSASIPCGNVGVVSTSIPGRGRIAGRGLTLARLGEILKSPFTGVDRPIVDHTGLTGIFDFSIEWAVGSDDLQARDGTSGTAAAVDAGPTFLEALQEQLGLKLESSRGPVDVLVIDHVEHPTED